MKLLDHWRVPEVMRYNGYYRFTGNEVLLHYLYWLKHGGSKLQMSLNMFGGDPRSFTYSIRLMTNHLYNSFYHNISGVSMRMWMPQIDEFLYAI